jgi:hypothetical protein
MKFVLLWATLIIVVSATTSIAQETTGHLQGRVLDPEGEPVSFVQVIVKGPGLQGPRNVMSLPDGYFYVLALPVGEYTVQLVHVTYQQSLVENILIRLGAYTNLGDIRLKERVYEAPEIVVSGKAPLIDPSSTEVGANLIAAEYAELPIDRNYRDMTTLLPHVNKSGLGDPSNYAGATGWENKFNIDGVDVTEPVYGGASTDLPYNFIREVKVRSGGYQAEFQGALGGVVDVITHSGSNDVRGQVFGFFLNDQLAAEPRLTIDNPEAGTFSFYDIGGCIGGPIKPDKLWYFLSYNPTVKKEQVNIPGLGLKDYESTSHRFASKLTWRINNKNDIELSVFGDPTTGEGIAGQYAWLDPPAALENVDPMLKDTKAGGISGLVNGRHWLHDRFLLQSTASVVVREDEFVPNTKRGLTEPLYTDLETGVWSGGSPFDSEIKNVTFNLGLKGTWILSNHTLKAGLHYSDLETDFKVRNDVITRYADNLYDHFTHFIDVTVGSREPSAFLQDSWRLWDILRLNLGVRWDGQYIINSEGDVGQRFLDQWQPRLGFTYQVGARGTHQLFGSFGRFYQNVSMAAPALNFISSGYYRVFVYDHDPRTDPELGEGDSILIDYNYQALEETEGLEGQHYDEFTLGYEQQITQNSKFTVRGIYRMLRKGLEDGYSEQADQYFWGNPGSGDLSNFPKLKREYTTLELTFKRTGAERFNFLASYLLSRNTGNYPGVFPSDYGFGWANASAQVEIPEQFINSDGLLPNDRPHVFKFYGSYQLGYGVTTGTTFFWMSGTPLSEFGASMYDPYYKVFITPRGEAGRTPSIWDLGVRVTYDLSSLWTSSVHPRVIADFLHIASRREAVNFVQRKFLARDDDGNHIIPNTFYGEPTAFQPPAAIRLGLEIDF